MNEKGNETMKKEVLGKNQKKRMIQWEIPHLMGLLKKKWNLSSIHLITAPFPVLYERDWFFLEGKVGFPLFSGKNFFGVLICFRSGRREKKLSFVFPSFKEMTISERGEGNGRAFKPFLKENPRPSEVRTFIDCYLQSRDFLSRDYKKTEITPKKMNKELFPLLLPKNKKSELLKMAHNLYLKTSAFAFLNTEAFKWKKGIFQEMNGVFVCIPSFEELSDFQKKVLRQDLKKNCPSFLVMGFRKTLPEEWVSIFKSK